MMPRIPETLTINSFAWVMLPSFARTPGLSTGRQPCVEIGPLHSRPVKPRVDDTPNSPKLGTAILPEIYEAWERPVMPLVSSGPGLLLWLLAGCAWQRPHLDRQLHAERATTQRNRKWPSLTVVTCPDVLEVAIAGRPDLSGRHAVGPDGRIDLGEPGPPAGRRPAGPRRLPASWPK